MGRQGRGCKLGVGHSFCHRCAFWPRREKKTQRPTQRPRPPGRSGAGAGPATPHGDGSPSTCRLRGSPGSSLEVGAQGDLASGETPREAVRGSQRGPYTSTDQRGLAGRVGPQTVRADRLPPSHGRSRHKAGAVAASAGAPSPLHVVPLSLDPIILGHQHPQSFFVLNKRVPGPHSKGQRCMWVSACSIQLLGNLRICESCYPMNCQAMISPQDRDYYPIKQVRKLRCKQFFLSDTLEKCPEENTRIIHTFLTHQLRIVAAIVVLHSV